MTERSRGAGWLAKFEKWVVRPEADGEYRMYCPLHENPDTSRSASASMNPARGQFMCFSRCGGYALAKVWQMVQEGETPEPKVQGEVRDIGSARSRRSAPEKELPSLSKLEEWHERLLAKRSLVAEMQEKRGLREATLEDHLIGWNGERYTIPVWDADDNLVNVRRYKLGAQHDKMLNWPGHGDARLFLPEALEDSKILICEGEMDALLATQYGFPALSVTAGAGTWDAHWTPWFFGKSVYIVYDVDEAGEKGARKVAGALRGVASAVRIVKLPLTKKGSDLTDYFVNQGYSRSNFVSLLKSTPIDRDMRVSRQRAQEQATPVRMRESFSPSYLDKPVQLVATVSGRGASPSALPKKVEYTCDQEWQKPKCARCPMETLYGGQHVHQVSADDQVILRMLEKAEDQRQQEILKDLDIPRTCPRIQGHVVEQWRVDELAVVPNVDDPEESDSETILRRVFNVTSAEGLTPVNTTARITGVSTADPRNGKVVMQSWDFQETKTSIDHFQMTPELLAELEATFHPKGEQTPLQKLAEIAKDLAANVTHIYGRPELHIAYDLVWHSILSFRFRNAMLDKGWLELLVMGDTRTGKSEAALQMTRHYQAGILKSCEGATLAGLVGGAQQIGSSWVITWGTIPLQDRRLVILDEVSGIADKNVLEQMSAVRSSGRAQVSKIVSQETMARTRLIWVSNPKDGRFINQHTNGAIDAIQTLIQNPEDVARFDLAMVAASDDVDSSVINAARPPRADHRHTTALCSSLVTWAWSRHPDQVVWDRGVERLVLQCAEEMGGRYIADPPLVQGENVRVKLARVAVAIAARLFSHDGTGEVVLARREHVRAAVAFLDHLYSMKRFGYADHSRKELRAKDRAASSRAECRRWLVHHDQVLRVLVAVINDTQFRNRDFQDMEGIPNDEAGTYIAELLRLGMIRRRSKGYITMTPELVGIVRELQEEEE